MCPPSPEASGNILLIVSRGPRKQKQAEKVVNGTLLAGTSCHIWKDEYVLTRASIFPALLIVCCPGEDVATTLVSIPVLPWPSCARSHARIFPQGLPHPRALGALGHAKGILCFEAVFCSILRPQRKGKVQRGTNKRLGPSRGLPVRYPRLGLPGPHVV